MTDSLLTTTQPSEEGGSGTNDTAETMLGSRVNGQSDPKVFTQEDIEKAREQEKSKMYKRLETMQETVARLEAEARQRAEAEEAAQRLIQTQQQQEEAEARKRAESEMSAKELLAQKEQEWQAQLAQVQSQVEAERALRERETQFAQLMEYRQQVVQQYSDRVAPELLDLIEGDTPEEIVASANDMAARTERILAQTAEAMQNQRQQMPTARVTSPVSGDNPGSNRNYTPEEIRNMSMSDYAKHRKSLLGGGASGGPTNRGLFG
jgi:hypothetical protein